MLHCEYICFLFFLLLRPNKLLCFHLSFLAASSLFSGSFRIKQPNQSSVTMQPEKPLKPVSLARPFSVTTLLLWKLMKWLWVESHFTNWLSRYAWRSNTSLIFGIAISLHFIWVNLKISVLVIQEHCFANSLLEKINYFSTFQTSNKVFWKNTTYQEY